MPSTQGGSSRRRTGWRLLRRGALLLILLGLAVFGYQAARTAMALRSAQTAGAQFQQQLSQGNVPAAERAMSAVSAAGRTARENSDNVLWDIASRVPWVGHDVAAVQIVSGVLDETARTALPSVLHLYGVLSRGELRDRSGRLDLARVASLKPQVGRVAAAASSGADRLDQIHANDLVSPLDHAVSDLQTRFATLSSSARAGRVVTALLPTMLGADGVRNYLLVVQNNAEIRPTGGLPGSFSLLRVRNGKADLRTNRSGVLFPILHKPAAPVTAEERALYGVDIAEDMRQSNLTPDFPRTAVLMDAMFERSYGKHLDGVISVDPIALSMVLEATGPVRVRGESFTAQNAVANLLNRPYQRLATQDEQNTYFASSAQDIFDALLHGPVNEQSAVAKLAEAAGQRRLLVWSRHSREQDLIRGTAASGELPEDTGGTPHVGIYLQDVTAAKMQYYLDYTGALSSLHCTREGTQTIRAGLVLTSSAPRDPSGLSTSVTGAGDHVKKGSMRMILRVYAPTGGRIIRLEANEQPVKILTLPHEGRSVAVVDLTLRPREQIRLAATLSTRAGQRRDPVLQWTPGMRSQPNGASAPSACG